MEKILNKRKQQYLNLKLILEIFRDLFSQGERLIDIDKIGFEIFQTQFKAQFENREFETIYNYLDAIVDATEHGFETLFDNPKIDYPVKEAFTDIDILIKAITDCIDNNEILSGTCIFEKIRMKVD